MNRRLLTLALAGLTGATMIVPALASAATSVAYDSTPAPGVVSVPSVGAESYSFNHIGNEVILRPHHGAIHNVAVTMESLACQHGGWSSGCITKPGARFQEPITLTLYRAAKANAATGEIRPGRQIMHVTKTFAIRYRPSSISNTESRYMGSDGQLHNGIAQTITFPVNRKLGNDVVWAVSYNTNTSGPRPTGVAGPADSLNVGLVPAPRIGHDRFPNSLFWDTRYAGFTGGAPFVTGQLNLDGGSWTGQGLVPAARFSVR